MPALTEILQYEKTGKNCDACVESLEKDYSDLTEGHHSVDEAKSKAREILGRLDHECNSDYQFFVEMVRGFLKIICDKY